MVMVVSSRAGRARKNSAAAAGIGLAIRDIASRTDKRARGDAATEHGRRAGAGACPQKGLFRQAFAAARKGRQPNNRGTP